MEELENLGEGETIAQNSENEERGSLISMLGEVIKDQKNNADWENCVSV